ncbi:NAD(P)/FAD-dependent oxidoreductase, partial [Rhodovibrio salinarum]
GAAGLMCARVAGQRGRRVAVVEHMPEVGKKILISGGGRCNFTNLEIAAVHASLYNHFNHNRHLTSRTMFKANRSAALAEWQQLTA